MLGPQGVQVQVCIKFTLSTSPDFYICSLVPRLLFGREAWVLLYTPSQCIIPLHGGHDIHCVTRTSYTCNSWVLLYTPSQCIIPLHGGHDIQCVTRTSYTCNSCWVLSYTPSQCIIPLHGGHDIHCVTRTSYTCNSWVLSYTPSQCIIPLHGGHDIQCVTRTSYTCNSCCIYPFPVHHSTAWRSRQSHFDLQHSYCTKELCHMSDDVLFGLIRHWTSLVSGTQTLATGYKFTRLGRIWGREYVSGESFVVVVQSGKKEHIVQHTIYNTGLHYVTMTTKHSEQ